MNEDQAAELRWEHVRELRDSALREIVGGYELGRHMAMLYLPSDHARDDVLRVVAAELWREGLAEWTIVLEPSIARREQLLSPRRWDAAITRCHLPHVRVARLESSIHLLTHIGHAEVLIGTLQLALRNVEFLEDWVSNTIARTQRVPVVVAHEYSIGLDENSYSRMLDRLAGAGAIVVLVVTERRGDARPIDFAEFNPLAGAWVDN